MTKYYNNLTLSQLYQDNYWKEFTKDMNDSWIYNSFPRISKLRKEYIVNFSTCPWKNLIRVYTFVNSASKKYTCPIMEKLKKDCLDEIRKRKDKGELIVSNEKVSLDAPKKECYKRRSMYRSFKEVRYKRRNLILKK